MGAPINYGLCNGGPFNKKHLADHRAVFRVAIDKATRKVIPALTGSRDPGIAFGAYHFADGAWNWQPPDSE